MKIKFHSEYRREKLNFNLISFEDYGNLLPREIQRTPFMNPIK